jgi:hypothetical protein
MHVHILLQMMTKKETTLFPPMPIEALNWFTIHDACDTQLKKEGPEV